MNYIEFIDRMGIDFEREIGDVIQEMTKEEYTNWTAACSRWNKDPEFKKFIKMLTNTTLLQASLRTLTWEEQLVSRGTVNGIRYVWETIENYGKEQEGKLIKDEEKLFK